MTPSPRSPSGLLCVAANPSVDRFEDVGSLTAGGIHRPSMTVVAAGGKGLNVGRVSRTMGATVTAAAIVGGYAGRWIESQLASLGIEASLTWSTAETRTCVSIHDRSTGAITELYEAGAPIDAATWDAFEEAVGVVVRSGSIGLMSVSGSVMLGTPPNAYRRLCDVAKAAGIRVAVDASGPILVETLAARPWLIKVNAEEAGSAVGHAIRNQADALAAATAIRQRTGGAAVVTRGAEGAVLVTAEGAWAATPPAAGPSGRRKPD